MTRGPEQPFPVWLHADARPDDFPAIERALDYPNGLLAFGGDLSGDRLLAAYRRGIFPWYVEGQPIQWWSPAPRAVLYPDKLHLTRRLRRKLRQGRFRVTVNRVFAEVIDACAAPAEGRESTWITPEMARAYLALHERGHAWSVESWCGDTLAGGVYGICLGRMFFGESMFTRVTDGSKVAIAGLCSLGFGVIDCQFPTPHLESLGAECISRSQFKSHLGELCMLRAPDAPNGLLEF
tara:strand:+ start:105 stop:815 length:711 start_codon:yes stop_codon:yes gene_type:complete